MLNFLKLLNITFPMQINTFVASFRYQRLTVCTVRKRSNQLSNVKQPNVIQIVMGQFTL